MGLKVSRLLADKNHDAPGFQFCDDRQHRKEPGSGLFENFAVTQFCIARVFANVAKNQRLAAVRHSADDSLTALKGAEMSPELRLGLKGRGDAQFVHP